MARPHTAATDTAAGQMPRPRTLRMCPRTTSPFSPRSSSSSSTPARGRRFVDCTFGGGGHARLIAERLGAEGELIAVDRDPSSEARWREFAADAPSRARFLRADFVAALEGLRGEGVRPDGIVFDLGMSSLQLDAWERGFSYAFDAPLDMRMDPDQELTAAEIVNEWEQDRLARVLREFGEERRAGSIAREIVRRRPLDHHLRAGRGGEGGDPARRALRPRASREALLPGDPDRGQRRARGARPRPAPRLAAARGRGPARRDLLPLARGPAGEALPRRPGARLRLPARASGLRLRPRARGRAAQPPGDRPEPRRRSSEIRAPPRRTCAPRASFETRNSGLMANPALASAAPSAAPRRRTPRRTSASPRARTARRAGAQAKPRSRPQSRSRPRDASAPPPARRVVQPAFAGAAAGAAMLPGAALRSAGRGPRPLRLGPDHPPHPRARLDRGALGAALRDRRPQRRQPQPQRRLRPGFAGGRGARAPRTRASAPSSPSSSRRAGSRRRRRRRAWRSRPRRRSAT